MWVLKYPQKFCSIEHAMNPKMDPKMDPKWAQNEPKNGPKKLEILARFSVFDSYSPSPKIDTFFVQTQNLKMCQSLACQSLACQFLTVFPDIFKFEFQKFREFS